MELSYWESRWRKNNTGFHMPGGYPGLRQYWDSLSLPESPHILVPLCGKSEDMVWMKNLGAGVTGVEISEKAIIEFYHENNLRFKTVSYAGFRIFRSEKIIIWQGDFLKLPKQKLPEFDLIYDKAALTALPLRMRSPYCKKLLELCSEKTKILLHHFIYNQDEMPGPPFSVDHDEIDNAFSKRFSIRVLEKNDLQLSNFPKFQRRGLSEKLTEQLLVLTPSG